MRTAEQHNRLTLTFLIALVSGGCWPVATHAGWNLQLVDGSDFDETSLQVDSAGNAHAVYAGKTLYYAFNAGGSWRREPISTVTSGGEYFSLAVDGAGNPSVSYWDGCFEDLRLVRFDGVRWRQEIVASDAGDYSMLAISAAGLPAISDYNATTDQLRLFRFDGSTWEVVVIDTPAAIGYRTAIGFDGADRAVIAWAEPAGGLVRVARDEGTSFSIATAAAGTGVRQVSLAIQPDGNPAVAFLADGAVRLARFDGSSWSTVTVDADAATANELALTYDALGRPVVAYASYGPYQVRVGIETGLSWTVDVIASDNVDGVAVAADPVGRVRVGAERGGEFVVFTLTAGTWSEEVVAVATEAGQWPALALTPAGMPMVSYEDQEEYDLRMASFDGSRWSSELVDPRYETGVGSSIAVDGVGNVTIANFDEDNGAVEVHRWDGALWQHETVDTADVGFNGHSLSVAVDSTGAAAIAYGDDFDGLRFARDTGASWQIETLAAEFEFAPTLKFDALDRPAVAYAGPDGLMFTQWNGAAWDLQSIDDEVCEASCLAFAPNGEPAIAYFKDDNLLYVRGGSWGADVVEFASGYADACSLAFSPSGTPMIAYRQEWSERAVLAWHNGTRWIVETFDPDTDAGMQLSLAVDGAGLPSVAYHDDDYDLLKVARRDDWRYAIWRGATPNSYLSLPEGLLDWTDPEPVLDPAAPPVLFYQVGAIDRFLMVKDGLSVRITP